MPHSLPPLQYGFDAMEPHIDAMTMETHYMKHHQAYVTNLNNALVGTGLEDTPLEQLLSTILNPSSTIPPDKRPSVRNNGGGTWNHSLYWELLSPTSNPTSPSGGLITRINTQYGSLADFQAQVKAAGMSIFGSGWAWVLANPDGSLEISTTPNQDNPIMHGKAPKSIVYGFDFWEHAYYLKHKNLRANYIDASWNVINWTVLESRYQNAIAP